MPLRGSTPKIRACPACSGSPTTRRSFRPRPARPIGGPRRSTADMSGRIGGAFARAREQGRGALIPFLTSGFPDLAESDRLASALCDEGADILELGVPFSDPLADGPIIQRTTQAALEQGTTLAHVLGQALRLRSR